MRVTSVMYLTLGLIQMWLLRITSLIPQLFVLLAIVVGALSYGQPLLSDGGNRVFEVVMLSTLLCILLFWAFVEWCRWKYPGRCAVLQRGVLKTALSLRKAKATE